MSKKDAALKELSEMAGTESIDRVDPVWLKLTDTPGETLVGKLLHVEQQKFETGVRNVYTLAKRDGTRVRLPGQTNLDAIMSTISVGTCVGIQFVGFEKARNGQRVGKWEVYAPSCPPSTLPASPSA